MNAQSVRQEDPIMPLGSSHKKESYFKQYWFLYLFLIPIISLAILFNFLPMSALFIAFKDVDLFAGNGILDSLFKSNDVGWLHFHRLFREPAVWNAFKNTLIISAYKIVFLFPLPILLAVLLNELTSIVYKRISQTLLYLPHFLSWVVVTALFVQILGPYGVINNMLRDWGLISRSVQFFGNAGLFRPLIVISSGWKEVGWSAIIYLAAITGINPQLYEAAKIDGASKIQRIAYITVPSISSTIAMLFTLRLGSILNADFDQIFNMYGPSVYSTGDIIGTYVYRMSFQSALPDYGFSTAVGLFNSITAFIFIMGGNFLSRKFFKKGLW